MADPASKLYLFKGNQYLKVDPTTMVIEGQPSSIGDWSGLAGALNGGQEIDKLDAVTYLMPTASQYPSTVLFLKADKYCIFDPLQDAVIASGQITDFFKHLHTGTDVDFTHDIDAAFSDSGGYLHWFKSGYEAYSALSSVSDFGNTSRPISAWLTGLYPYTMGIQGIISFSGDYYAFRGDSWVSHNTGKSITIETLIPGTQALGFDYELDDLLLAPFDKKMPVSSDIFPLPAGTGLTVTVLNNLSAQATVAVDVGSGSPDTIQATPAKETYKTYTVANAGQVSISVTDSNSKTMRLAPNNQTVGGGYCRYIGAEQKAAGVYTDVVVLVTWPSKVT